MTGCTAITLGRLTKIDDLRSVWKNEATDFTRWLSQEQNLNSLGDAIDMDLELDGIESSVGEFRVDILCREKDTTNRVIIENQLEPSNHEHLGKLVTYASGKDARVVIWIVKTAREEHAKAIEWLNEHTDIDFFLIEMELWRIGDSEVAPKFSIIEKPNGWQKRIKQEDKLSPSAQFRMQFWDAFKTFAVSNKDFASAGFHTTKAWEQSFYDLRFGTSMAHVVLSIATQQQKISACLYFQNNKDAFFQLKERHKDDVESFLGAAVVWSEGKKDCTVGVERKIVITDEQNWNEGMAWLCHQAMLMKEVFRKYVEA